MEWGNCSKGPVSRLTVYVALFPALAKSTSLKLENHLRQIGRQSCRNGGPGTFFDRTEQDGAELWALCCVLLMETPRGPGCSSRRCRSEQQ